ncbi:LysR family transcriptional regulator [Kutzneria buriramensis]|uniref:DNA-binding transcriptional LysR family regulator n=1 Tax=Kutzneria buriramensis TaxID=1045776 RepID=A0A3E0HQG3_9PSEU|nr:LysR family transcriptional regulator [Kutzneria buriramensis]REH48500.1 DNA-binding transcriptional LysR family regulator [Kutzneria buriramensis]
MRLEVRHARVVAAVAELGSISKAAASLSLPQPSLTAQLRRIEKTIGGELFVRSRTGITPTPLGERLIPMLVDLARSADAVLAEAASPVTDVLGVVSAEWEPAVFWQGLRDQLAGYEVRTSSLDPDGALDAVVRGEYTAALVRGPETAGPPELPDSTLDSQLVMREPTWLAVPSTHRLSRDPITCVGELDQLPWVRHAPGHWLHNVEQELLEAVRPTVLHYVSGQAEAMNWVRDAGVVALTVPSAQLDDVALVPLPGVTGSRLTMVWRRGWRNHTGRRRLLSAIRRTLRAQADRHPCYRDWLAVHLDEFPELKDCAPA